VAWKVLPFFLIMCGFAVLITIFPAIVTWPADFILSR
jgi:C4-dicarboxylate transporter, DctM subunit